MPVKKVIDKWKAKTWFTVIAPRFLGEVEIARVPATGEEGLLNRVITLPLREITRDISHIYTNVSLRVHEIKGKSAYTKFIGHEVSREYIGTLIKRRRDVLHVVLPVVSKDGVEFKVKALVVTGVICSRRQKALLRNMLQELLTRRAANTEFGKFIQEALFGRLGPELFSKLKRIAPLRRVEIRKTELKEEFDVEAKPEDAALAPEEGEGVAPAEGKEKEQKEKASAPEESGKPSAATVA